MIGTVPGHIATEQIKKQILEKRKNMMVRAIYTDLRCKMDSEWTPAKITTVVNNHDLQCLHSRPKRVLNHLVEQERQAALARQAVMRRMATKKMQKQLSCIVPA